MKFRKIKLLALSMASIFSISMASVFAGTDDTKQVSQKRSSASAKKPRVNKKYERRIGFCTRCGGHTKSVNSSSCDNKKCIAVYEILKGQRIPSCDIKICLSSELEQEKENFPECPMCGKHDVKLMCCDKWVKVWCHGRGKQCRRVTGFIKLPSPNDDIAKFSSSSGENISEYIYNPSAAHFDRDLYICDHCGFRSGLG